MNPDSQIQREAVLRRAVMAGDEAAWRSWCLENFDELDRFVLWRCGCRRDLADDIVQETWLTAVRRIRNFNPQEGKFLAWLRGIAANIRRNHLRRQRRLATQERAFNGSEQLANEEESNVDDPISLAEEQQRVEQIAAVLDGLSERQEAVLRAKYLDKLSVAEIALRWNDTPKAIESLLSRARQAFRERFEKTHETK